MRIADKLLDICEERAGLRDLSAAVARYGLALKHAAIAEAARG